uniref:Uncharacterized protein n=1 Tax=Labrus bergylta TaxID=56723 RepID=A0A3Q3ND44_9LABR
LHVQEFLTLVPRRRTNNSFQKLLTEGQCHKRWISVPASPQPCQHKCERESSIFFNLVVSHCTAVRDMPKSLSHWCLMEDKLSKEAVENKLYRLETNLFPEAIFLSLLSNCHL